MNATQKLQALYDSLPKLDCQGKCQECCGPVMVGRREGSRIKNTTGVQLTVAPSDLRKLKSELQRLNSLPDERLTCPLLTEDGRCLVYSIRPMVCRLWGVTEDMKCGYGCKPEWYLSRQEAKDFLNQAIAVY